MMTPRNPPSVLKSTVTTMAAATDCTGLSPSMTPPILMAASVTLAMMTTLKSTPR